MTEILAVFRSRTQAIDCKGAAVRLRRACRGCGYAAIPEIGVRFFGKIPRNIPESGKISHKQGGLLRLLRVYSGLTSPRHVKFYLYIILRKAAALFCAAA